MSREAAVSKLNKLLKEWDSGVKYVRRGILQDFVAHHQGFTGPQLETEFADGASLFLARICAWLRLTYMIGTCVCEQLQAIQIFVKASDGTRYIDEFVEVGGIMTVIEILAVKQAKEYDKAAAVELLSCIASSGRKYKELICESYGIRATAECLARSRSEQTQERCRELLESLAQGNPQFHLQVYKGFIALLPSSSHRVQQMAAQSLQTVQRMVETALPAIVEPTLNLLKSLHPEVHCEAIDLIRLLMDYEVRDSLIERLVRLLRPLKEELVKPLDIMPDSEVEKIPPSLPVFVQQAAAAKCIRLLAESSNSTTEEFSKLPLVNGLLHAMSNQEHTESQKEAAITLQYFCRTSTRIDDDVRNTIGHSLHDMLMNDAESFHTKVTPLQLQVLNSQASS